MPRVSEIEEDGGDPDDEAPDAIRALRWPLRRGDRSRLGARFVIRLWCVEVGQKGSRSVLLVKPATSRSEPCRNR